MGVKNTNRDINRLNPNFKEKVKLFLKEVGDKVFITEGWRSKERQDYLWSLGRTRPGKKVTWVRHSNHQDGLAIDIAFKGKELYPKEIQKWRQIADIAKKYGIDWGYDLWKADKPHFQDNGKPLNLENYGTTTTNDTVNTDNNSTSNSNPFSTDKYGIIWGAKYKEWSDLPLSINGIPIKYRKTNSKTYGIAYVKGYVPNLKSDYIIVTSYFLEKYGKDKTRIIKLVLHEFYHFIYHRYFNDNEKQTIKEMFERNNEKGFISKYSKKTPEEYAPEVYAWVTTYIAEGKQLPSGRQYNGGIAVDYMYLKGRFDRYIDNFKK